MHISGIQAQYVAVYGLRKHGLFGSIFFLRQGLTGWPWLALNS